LGFESGPETGLSRPRRTYSTDPYNLWVITTTAEALAASIRDTTAATDLPDGLTVDDALRIAEAVASRLAESTRRV
jgi:hypothetical protein